MILGTVPIHHSRQHGCLRLRLTALFVIVVFTLFDLTRFVPQSYAGPVESGTVTDPLALSIPKELGKIEDVYFAPTRGDSEKTIGRAPGTIVFIQDAHDSLEAQENIAKLIGKLVKEKGIKTVFEEGYEGLVPTDNFFGFMEDPGLKQKVSYFLLDKLRIGAAEYAHINRENPDGVKAHTPSFLRQPISSPQSGAPSSIRHPDSDWQLIGVDDFKLYGENIRSYRDASRTRKETGEDLKELLTQIATLADRYFPKSLKVWLKVKDRFAAGKLPLLNYLRELQAAYPKKQAAFFAEKYPAISLLLAARTARDPELINQLNALDSEVAFTEIQRLERDIAVAHLKNDRDRRIFDHYQDLSLLGRLNRIELTQPEFEAVKERLQRFETQGLADFIVSLTRRSLVLSKEWERHIKDAVRFYDVAYQRDNAISSGLDRYFLRDGHKQGPDELGSDTAIMVYGGFHANRIKELLRNKGVSYVVVVPAITAIDKKHQECYKQLMSVGHYPFEAPFLMARANRPPSIYFSATGEEVSVRSELRAIAASVEALGDRSATPLIERNLLRNGMMGTAPESAKPGTGRARAEMRQAEKGEESDLDSGAKSWVIYDPITGTEKGMVFQAPRLPKPEDLKDQDAAWRDFNTMVFEFPKLLERAAREKISVVLILPEKLDGFGPLEDEAPWIEGARTALAWASAYFRFKELGNVDVRVLQLPAQKVSQVRIADAVKKLLVRNIRDDAATPEGQMEARIFRWQEVLGMDRVPSSALKQKALKTSKARGQKQDRTVTLIRPVLPDVPQGKQRIMITGAAGFIGSNLVKKFLAEGNQVVALDSMITANRDFLSFFRNEPNFYFRQWDVAEPFEIEGRVDQVLHLASLASPPDYYGYPRETLRAGLDGTRQVLELARRKKARLLFTSTSEVYGDAEVHPQPETYAGNVSSFRKRSQYDQSKRGAETLMKLYAARYKAEGIDLRIARLFNTYGPYMRIDDGRVITNFIERVLRGKPIEIYGSDKITRSFGYVDDTVEGLLKLLRTDRLDTETPIQDRVFNIGNDGEFTLRELADLTNELGQKHLGWKVEVVVGEVKDPSDPGRRRPNLERARGILGYDPKVALSEGLEKTFLYFLMSSSYKTAPEVFRGGGKFRSEVRLGAPGQHPSGSRVLIRDVPGEWELPGVTVRQEHFEHVAVMPEEYHSVLRVNINGAQYSVGHGDYLGLTLPSGKKIYWGGQHNLSYAFFFKHFGERAQDRPGSLRWRHADQHRDLNIGSISETAGPRNATPRDQIEFGLQTLNATNYLGFIRSRELAKVEHATTIEDLDVWNRNQKIGGVLDIDLDILVHPRTAKSQDGQMFIERLAKAAGNSEVIFITNSSELQAVYSQGHPQPGYPRYLDPDEAIVFGTDLVREIAGQDVLRSEMRTINPAESIIKRLGESRLFPDDWFVSPFVGAGLQQKWLRLTDFMQVVFVNRNSSQAIFKEASHGQKPDAVHTYHIPRDLTVGEAFQWMADIRKLSAESNRHEIHHELAKWVARTAVWMAQEAVKRSSGSREAIPVQVRMMTEGLYGIGLSMIKEALDGVTLSVEAIVQRHTHEITEKGIFDWLGLSPDQIRKLEAAFKGDQELTEDIMNNVFEQAIRFAAGTLLLEIKALTYFHWQRRYKSYLERPWGQIGAAVGALKDAMKNEIRENEKSGSEEKVREAQIHAVKQLSMFAFKIPEWSRADDQAHHREPPPHVQTIENEEINSLGRITLMAMYLEEFTEAGLLKGVKVWSAVKPGQIKLYMAFGNIRYWLDAANRDVNRQFYPVAGSGTQEPAFAEGFRLVLLKNGIVSGFLGNLGFALKKRGKMDEAAAAYREALLMDRDDAALLSQLGDILMAQGKADGAIAVFRKAVEIDPNNADLHNKLWEASAGAAKSKDYQGPKAGRSEMRIAKAGQSPGNIALMVAPDQEAAFDAVARRFLSAAKEEGKNNKPVLLGVGTGSTLGGVLKAIVRLYKEDEGIDLSRVAILPQDEYAGLSGDDPQSYRYFIYHNFIKPLREIDPKRAIKDENFYFYDGRARDPQAEIGRIQKIVKDHGGIRLQLIAGGPTHYAFLEKAASIKSSGTLDRSAAYYNDFVIEKSGPEKLAALIRHVAKHRRQVRQHLSYDDALFGKALASRWEYLKNAGIKAGPGLEQELAVELDAVGLRSLKEQSMTFFIPELTPELSKKVRQWILSDLDAPRIVLKPSAVYWEEFAKAADLTLGDTVLDNSRFFESLEKIPLRAYTHVGAVLDAEEIVQIACKPTMAEAVKDMFTQPVEVGSHPMAALRAQRKIISILTPEAAQLIPYVTRRKAEQNHARIIENERTKAGPRSELRLSGQFLEKVPKTSAERFTPVAVVGGSTSFTWNARADNIVRAIREDTNPATVFLDAEDFSGLSPAQKQEFLIVAFLRNGIRVVVYNERGQVHDAMLDALLKLERAKRTDADLGRTLAVYACPGEPSIHMSKDVSPDQTVAAAHLKNVAFFREYGEKSGTLATALLWAISGGEGAKIDGVRKRDGFWYVEEALLEALQSSYVSDLAVTIAA